MSNPIGDAINALDIHALDGVLCEDIHPIINAILEESSDSGDNPFALIPSVEEQISRCITTETMRVITTIHALGEELGDDDVAALIMAAVQMGFIAKERYLEQHATE